MSIAVRPMMVRDMVTESNIGQMETFGMASIAMDTDKVMVSCLNPTINFFTANGWEIVKLNKHNKGRTNCSPFIVF